MKNLVINSAKKNNSQNTINFMSGGMGGTKITNVKEYSAILESAISNGNAYFMVSFGPGKEGLMVMKDFAKEIIPSFT